MYVSMDTDAVRQRTMATRKKATFPSTFQKSYHQDEQSAEISMRSESPRHPIQNGNSVRSVRHSPERQQGTGGSIKRPLLRTSKTTLSEPKNPRDHFERFDLPALARSRTYFRAAATGWRQGASGTAFQGVYHSHWGVIPPKRMAVDTDKRIVQHLRKRLNTRIELRQRHEATISQAGDDDNSAGGTERLQSQRGQTPFDIYRSYDDFGQKVARRSGRQHPGVSRSCSRVRILDPITTPDDPQRPQDGGVDPGGGRHPSGAGHVAVISDSIGLLKTRDVTSDVIIHHDDVSAGARRGDSPVTNIHGEGQPSGEGPPEGDGPPVEEGDPPVSPVPTPVVFRPETREEGRLSDRDRVGRVLRGDMTVHCNPRARVIKIFINSAATDAQVEGSYLNEHVFPSLKEYALERGYDLEIIDPHWGLPDLMADDHVDAALMTSLLDQVQMKGDGLNFLSFLGQKYGTPMPPTTIPEDEMDAILEFMEEEHARQHVVLRQKADAHAETQRRATQEKDDGTGSSTASTGSSNDVMDTYSRGSAETSESNQQGESAMMVKFRQVAGDVGRVSTIVRAMRSQQGFPDMPDPAFIRNWYKLDTNAVPSVYRLQNISSHYKNIDHSDPRRRAVARSSWSGVRARLQQTLYACARVALGDSHVLAKYNMSLTDAALDQGLFGHSGQTASRFFWFHRLIEDLDEAPSGDGALRDYVDTSPTNHGRDETLAHALQELKRTKMSEIPADRCALYKVKWHPDGITPAKVRDHQYYLERLGGDVTNVIQATISELSRQRALQVEPLSELYRDVEQHAFHCRKRARLFHGRKSLLSDIKQYIRVTTGCPLVVYGKTGSGCSSLVAKAAKDAHKWLRGSPAATLVRFIGVTAASTNVRMLLRSLCLQLCHVLDADTASVPNDFKGVLNHFVHQLSRDAKGKTILIFLESVHRISEEHDGRKFAWLPRELPPHVRLVVSTATDDGSDCFASIKKYLTDAGSSFLEASDMTVSDASAILNHWLASANRRLTDQQRSVALQAFRGCPYPLYLRALYREILAWPSYATAEVDKLGTTVRSLATVLMGRLERTHGEALTRRALGYLTAARSGLTENEIQDLLSLDDAVMGDITAHYKPPLRRLPPVLWLRMRFELGEFLEETNADGCVTLQWSYSQFRQAAEERYLNNRDKAPSYHKALAEYFTDTWSQAPKPYPESEAGQLRHVVSQPLVRHAEDGSEPVYNRRRLSELPFHLMRAQQLGALKKSCLCNYEFLLAKISAMTTRALFEDIQAALNMDPIDSDLKVLSDTLHLSTSVLNRDPAQLASQLIGRLHDLVSKDVPVSPSDPVKYPFLKPLLAQAHRSSTPALVPSTTCLTPPGGILFDLLSGHTEPITGLVLSGDGLRVLTTSRDDTLKLWELRTGRVVRTLAGVGRNVLQVISLAKGDLAATSEISGIRLWDMRAGECIKTLPSDDPAAMTTAQDGQLLVAFHHGVNVMRTWSLDNRMSPLLEVRLDEGDGHVASVHRDDSVVVAGNSSGLLVLHAFRNASNATVRNAMTGNGVHTLKVQESGSVTALGVTAAYFIVAARYQYKKLHEVIELELFDAKNGKYVRCVKGCVADNICDLHVTLQGAHAVALCSSTANKMSDVAVWNLETEDHKHLARHARVSHFAACAELRQCLTGSSGENALQRWDLSGQVNQPAPREKVKDGVGKVVAMTTSSRYVITLCINGGPMAVWDVARGRCVRTERGLFEPSDVILIRDTEVVILADKGFSTVSDDRPPVYQTIRIYDLKERKYTHRLSGCYITPSPTHEYVLLGNDRLMGLADNRSHLVVWSLVTGHVISRIKTNFKHFGGGTSRIPDMMSVSGSGETLREVEVLSPRDHLGPPTGIKHRISGGVELRGCDNGKRRELEPLVREGAACEEDTRREQAETLRREKENAIEQYMISEDLSTIIASYYSHHLCVFDVASQSHTLTLENPNSLLLLHVAALTNDGRYLVHCNYDDHTKTSYVTMWDCKTGHVRRRLKNESNVCCVALTTSGSHVVFGKGNGGLSVWRPLGRKFKGQVRRLKSSNGIKLGVDSQIHLAEVAGDSGDNRRAVVYGDGTISIWDVTEGILLGVFTPDMRIQSFCLALGGRAVVFGVQETRDIVTLKLTSKYPVRPQPMGENLFGGSDDEDEEEGEEEGNGEVAGEGEGKGQGDGGE